jgi:UDP-N-acetylmuramoylalanine--D-glutamate ligase
MQQWTNKKVLVLGLGETGLSLVRWLQAQGAVVRVADSRAAPPGLAILRAECPEIELVCGAFSDNLLSDIELIALSPGIALRHPLVLKAAALGIPVVGDIELFAQALPKARRPKIIAITGSNGKTTVTSLVGAMCRAAGLDTVVAGNISPAVLDAWLDRQGRLPDVWVLELSSFQLETTHTLRADAATVLNVSEDHLDRHGDMAAYSAAKARIFLGCGVQVLNRDDARSLGMAEAGVAQRTFGLNAARNVDDGGIIFATNEVFLSQGRRRILNTKVMSLAGLHNAANALAALALCQAIGLPRAQLLAALCEFKGLPHRVERVAQIAGVTYFDDSKGTNVGATQAALQGLGQKSVLILGGEGKGQDFRPLNVSVAQHARAVVLIGRDAEQIASALAGCGVPLLHAPNLPQAVSLAQQQAQTGDAVLLSPACASFDMFRDYQHRAEVFVAAVYALQQEATCAA